MFGSLGELFVSLGFDVDDAKLEGFKNKLNDTKEIMNKLGKSASEALGGVAALSGAAAVFVQKSADGAVQLNNMQLMFGANAQAAQTFANALHQVNSQISVAAGQGIFGKFSQVVKGEVPLGAGQGSAIAQLGGYQNEEGFLGASAESVIANFAKNYDALKKQWGASYGVWLDRAGIGHEAEGAIALLAHNPSDYNAAGQYNLPEDQRQNLTEYAKSTSEFHEAITRFENTVAAHLAPAMTNFFNAVTRILNKLPSSEKVGDYLLEEKQREEKLGFWGTIGQSFSDVYKITTGQATIGWGSSKPSQETPASPSTAWGPGTTRGFRNNNPGNIKYGNWAAYHGAIGEDDKGFAVFPDMTAGERAISSLLMNYARHGRDTISSIVRRYTSGDSLDTQRSYEKMLENSTGRRSDDHLDISNPQVLKQLVTGIIQQENGIRIRDVSIHVHSNATDNHAVATMVKEHFQAILNPANSQINLNF